MTRLYVADGETYETFGEAIEAAAVPGEVLVVEEIGYVDQLAEAGSLPEGST
jgi:hypothetical protein